MADSFETYRSDRKRFCSNYRQQTLEETRTDAIRHSPLVSLAVKHAVDNPKSKSSSERTQSDGIFSGNGSSGGSFFGQTNALAPVSQHAPPASSPPALPQSASPFAFSKPFASFGTTSTTPTTFDGFKPDQTWFGFGQSAQPQHKHQPSLQSGPFSFASANKVPKPDESASHTNGRLTSDGTPSKSALFGGKENDAPTQGFSFASSQTNGNAAPRPTTSLFAPRTDTSNGFGSGANFKSFRSDSSAEAFAQPRNLAVPRKSMTASGQPDKDVALPQYGLLGFDLDNCDDEGSPEPILLNTNAPSSVFLCGSQGSGKSYTLSCMLENHLLHDASVGVQKQTIPGFVFHWDTNTSGSLAEAASLCSRGIKVRLLVSWSNYRQMKSLYENFASKSGGKIEVRPLLFEDTELTVGHIRNLMAFRDSTSDTPLYLEVIQNILRKLGRKSEQFSVKTFLEDLDRENFNKSQLEMLDLRLNILKTFSAVTAPDIVTQDYKGCNKQKIAQERKNLGLGFFGDCIRVEHGTLTIIDLSDPFVDASTACVLFDICLSIILKRHKEAVTANKIAPGLIITLDEAHKFLDKAIPSADIFTASLLTTIREQRHNAARVIIATQEPTISEKLLDLCSVSIVHRFNSPAWFKTLIGHLGAASKLAGDDSESETAESRAKLFERILALQVGESLVFSPTSYVRGGAPASGKEAAEPAKLGSGIMRMKTREREGTDAGKTWNVV